jgi:Protein of unknown function (DUF551)
MNEWIKVRDRLPQDDEPILFTDGENLHYGSCSQYDATVYWQLSKTLIGKMDESKQTTHWMPRPELPKEG